MLTSAKKKQAISKSQINEKDTGSADVQIAILTQKITEVSEHLKKHKKDISARRGLLKMVSNRSSHLKYLQKKNPERYSKSISIVKSK